MDSVAKASLHDILGFTKILVEWQKKPLQALEKIVVRDRTDQSGGAPVKFVESIETVLDAVNEYEVFLQKK